MTYSAKTKHLADICEIQTGYTARVRLDPGFNGVPAIQLRDLRGEESFDPTGLPLYPLSASFDRYWAKSGDVLFRSRGDKNSAVLVTGAAGVAAIAILPLMILRPRANLVDASYLVWFINQTEAQRYFDTCARGTSIRMIPKPCLDALEVPLPDLDAQRRIAEVAALARREQHLAQQLADKQLQLTEFALLRQARNAQPHGNEAGQTVARSGMTRSGKSQTGKLKR